MNRLVVISAACLLLALAVMAGRVYAVAAATARFHAQIAAVPVGALRASLRQAARIAPEAPEFLAAGGQALLLLARASEPAAAPLVAEQALGDLREALRFNPADATLWLSAALSASLAKQAGRAAALSREAERRAPWAPEAAWVAARLARLPAGREAAYRRVTALRPEATPAVLTEAAPGKPWEAQVNFVSATPAAYRYWAWSLSDATGVAVAQRGLVLATGPESRADAGWLAYYLALAAAREHPAESLALYRQAIAALPGEQAVFRNYGFALLAAGQAGEAERAFDESIRRHGDLGNAAYLGRAKAWVALGRQADARPVLERLAKNARLEAWVRREAGDELYRLEHTP